MNYQKKSHIDDWRVNPATFMLYRRVEFDKIITEQGGITGVANTQGVCRITANKTRIDNTSESRQTSFGGASEEVLMNILGLKRPWFIASFSVGMYPETDDYRDLPVRGEILVELDIERDLYPCPNCRTFCKVHQYETRHYSHPRMCGMATVIRARVPKLRCDVCDGFPQMEVPWARPRVSYTKMLEREVFLLLADLPVSGASKLNGLTMWTVWDMIRFRVNEALRRMDLSDVTMFYVDETSSKKGHNYITVVNDQRGRTIFVCEGKGSDTMDRLCQWLLEHGGNPDNIDCVSCDLGDAYPAGVRRNFPNGRIVYDRFHAVKLINDALDALTRREMSHHAQLRGIRRKLMLNPSAYSEEDLKRLESTVSEFRELSMNFRLKNVFLSIYEYTEKETASHTLDLWYDDVLAHGCREMVTAANSIMSRREGILAWFDDRVSNGYAEGINSLIQTTKRVARGYRNIDNFIAMIYLRDGHLDISFD